MSVAQGKPLQPDARFHFQSLSFLRTCRLLALLVSVQSPLMARRRNAQRSCGSAWALPASARRPALCELCVCRACCCNDVWNPQHLHVSFLGISNPLLRPPPSASICIWNAAAGAQRRGAKWTGHLLVCSPCLESNRIWSFSVRGLLLPPHYV